MKKTVRYLSVLILSVSILLVFIWSFFSEPGLLMVRNVSLDIPQWHNEHKDLKFVVLADFHIGFGHMTRDRLAEIIEKANGQNPDIVLLVGDYVNVSSKNEGILNYLEDFKNFRSKYGVYAVLGNHESWEVRHKIRYFLKKAGVKILENRAEKITVKEKSFWIAGIEDWTTGFPDVEKTLNQIDNEKDPVLFLSHDPDAFEKISSRVSLAIAGHTHGGQIYVPFLVRLLTPSRLGKRFLRGHIIHKGRHIYVSSGLGTTIIPARFLVPPEMVILNLK